MDFDIHEDARTEGVALRRGPFSHGRGGKAGREEEGVTVPARETQQTWRLVRMGDERGEGKLRRLADEKPAPNWLIMNGNRVQIKRKKFESFIDSTDVI